MSPALIAIVIFVVGAVVVAVAYGRSAGALLELEPGESVVLDQQPVRVESRSPIRTVVYGKCRVLVTGHRILIAQKPLFGKNYSAPRYVIELTQGGGSTEISSSLKQGAMEFSIPRSEVKVETKGRSEYVVIPVPESALTKDQQVRVRATDASALSSAIRSASAP